MKRGLGTLCLSMVLSVVMILTGILQKAMALSLDQAREETMATSIQMSPNPAYGSEWTVFALLRNEAALPEGYLSGYLTCLEQTLQETDGILHSRKYTEYARVVLALTAAGVNPWDVGGYNLVGPLGDRDAVLRQGVNGAIFALLALDAGNYPVPAAPSGSAQATRGEYVRAILEAQTKDGGFTLSGDVADADVTAMALTALAPYQGRLPGVSQGVQAGIACLSRLQGEDGCYASEGSSNCESTAQVVVALCTLGISLDDPRFVKHGVDLQEALGSFQVADGGFSHHKGEAASQMATEQALYALAALWRAEHGKTSLYDMADVKGFSKKQQGLPGKEEAVMPRAITAAGKTFPDIASHPARTAIETLAAYGVLNGKSDTVFDPNATMTRAEFAATAVRALGLSPQRISLFTDVEAGSWYDAYVGTAYSFGITKGTSSRTFTPNGTITREEAAVMVARAARLCGIETELTLEQQREILSLYEDGSSVSDWARASVAFCCKLGWMPGEELALLPQTPVLRSEVAEMFAYLLLEGDLLIS